MSELIEMFHKYNIFITKKDIEPLFKKADTNSSLGLDFEEFEKCVMDEKYKKIFSDIMKK